MKVSLRGRTPEAISLVQNGRLLRRFTPRNDMVRGSFSYA